jgi:hypothetical protein
MRTPAFPIPNLASWGRPDEAYFSQIEPDVKHAQPLERNIWQPPHQQCLSTETTEASTVAFSPYPSPWPTIRQFAPATSAPGAQPMVKILSGLVAVVVIAAGSFFGFQFYTQHRISSEIETAFEQIRAGGGKASYGRVSFDLLSRTVTIADITGESATQPPVKVKIGSIVVSNVGQPDAARFSADSIETSDIEIGLAVQTTLNVTYKVPHFSVKGYSGPAHLQRPPASASFIDVYRFALEQFAGITASSITAPNIAATINQGAATPGGGDVAYTGYAMQGIKDGKIASLKVDALNFTINMQPAGKPDRLTGNLANIAGYDIDTSAMAAIFDPQKINDDQYHRAYRQMTAGPYVVTSTQGVNMRIDEMIVDEVGLKPSHLQVPALLAILPSPGTTPTPAQARELLEKVAGVYEGLRIGNTEMRGITMQMPQGPIKLSTMRINLENGKINELALEGLDARMPNGPVKVGRFALKSLDVANLMRISALFLNPAQQPPPDRALAMIPLIEGAELKGLVAPFKNTGKPFNVDTFSLDWGQFVGPIPSKARLTLKMSSPLDTSDPRQQVLAAAGIDKAVIDLDLGAGWTETSRLFALEPVSIDLGGVLKASTRVSLANVPRGVFTPDLAQSASMAAQIEAGTLELTLRDTGGIDLAVAQQARIQNISREAARRAIVEGLMAGSEQAMATNPDAKAAIEAVARFIETSGQTLNIKLTPRAKVPALQLIQLLKTDPLMALAQFRIEASTGL